MEMEFWATKQLRQEFEVEASFYQIEAGENLYRCRNHAVILRKGYNRQEQKDAVVIMANPGSCSPKDSAYKLPGFQNRIPYVAVNDDPTQRQLMRIMKLMNWNVISIINLSDLCSGNMNDFKKILKYIKKHSYENHSIFSDDRTTEREKFLTVPHCKIILAWGKEPSINNLACEACRKLPKNWPIFGLSHVSPSWGYRHPNPMLKQRCVEWLEDMLQQLSKYNPHFETAATIYDGE